MIVMNSGKDMSISHIDTSQLKNGVYDGKYNGGRWSNEVSVVLEGGKITNIDAIKIMSKTRGGEY